MALSNTAVPLYYGQFRDAVMRGEIPVNKEISLEMNRIDDLIKNKGVYYDPDAINGWIAFCEEELTLSDGGDLHLLDTFKLWGEQVFGWYYFVDRQIYQPGIEGKLGKFVTKRIKKRLTCKQILIIGRGAAKSMYASCIQSYFLICDTSTTNQVTMAPTMPQASEVMNPIKTAIARHRGPLFEFMTEGSIQNTTGSRANRQKLCSTKKGVENFLTNSLLEVCPMTIDRIQGRKDKVVTIDEWLSGDVREDCIGAAEQGASKNEEYLVLAMSSEGTIRNGPGDDVKMEIMDILNGDYRNIRTSIWYYKLDDVEEIANPAMWVKANPNLGKTVQYEVYQADVEKAEKAPAARNDILAKRFGIPVEGYTYFFTYEETKRHRRQDFWRMPCALGADLSQGDDFCAFTFIFPGVGRRGAGYGVKSRSYITDRTLMKLPNAMRNKYQELVDEGTLIVLDGTVIDLDEVYEDLDAFIAEQEYDVRCFGYDPNYAKKFVSRWELENGPYGIEIVRQGARTETVPLGELKKLAEDRLLYFDEEIMSFTMCNAIVIVDNASKTKKLMKRAHDQKIDNVSALLDAWVAYKENKDVFD